MTRDAVRQLLAEISARAAAATPGPWVPRDLSGDGFDSENGAGWWWVWQESKLPYYGGVMEMDRALDKEGEFSRPGFLGDTTITDHHDGDTERSDAAFIAAARSDVPRLVAALTAVLDRHTEDVRDARFKGYCQACGNEFPCPDYRAVAAALEEQP